MRVRDDQLQRARKTDEALQGGRLPDTLRKAEVSAGSRTISQAGSKLCEAGPDREKDERYRMRAEDGRGKSQTAEKVQNGVAVSADPLIHENSGLQRTVEMTGGWKAGKSRDRIPPAFPSPLEIPQQRQDSHIPTAPATGPVAPNQNRIKNACLTAAANRTRKEKAGAETTPSTSRLQDHYVLETIWRFRIILRLENAPTPH